MPKALNIRARRKRDRKEALYAAAVRLFREQGFEETRVEEITRAAGVAKGTFFNYFATKEEVLLYIGERHLRQIGAAVAGQAGEAGSGEHGGIAPLKALLRAMAESLEPDRDLIRLAVDKAMYLSYLAPSGNSGRVSFLGLATLLIGRAQRAGEVHPDLDAASVAQILDGLFYQQLVLWCRSNRPYDLGDRLAGVVDLLVMGIGFRRVS